MLISRAGQEEYAIRHQEELLFRRGRLIGDYPFLRVFVDGDTIHLDDLHACADLFPTEFLIKHICDHNSPLDQSRVNWRSKEHSCP